MGTRWDALQLYRRAHCCHVERALSQRLLEDVAMPRSKQAAKKNRTTKATVTALGTAGLGLSLVGSASASTTPAAEIPTSDTMGSEHRFVLDETELADVSLATFHLFDKENIGSRVQQVQWGCRCGGCGW